MLTAFRMPVAVHSSGFTFYYRCFVERLTAEEGVDNIHTDVPVLNHDRHRASETENSVFAGGVHRSSGDAHPRRLNVRA